LPTLKHYVMARSRAGSKSLNAILGSMDRTALAVRAGPIPNH